jgi:hypothetical protein
MANTIGISQAKNATNLAILYDEGDCLPNLLNSKVGITLLTISPENVSTAIYAIMMNKLNSPATVICPFDECFEFM